MVIARADTVMSRPNAELAAAVFPDVPLAADVSPNETLYVVGESECVPARRVLAYVSSGAKRLKGFEPSTFCMASSESAPEVTLKCLQIRP